MARFLVNAKLLSPLVLDSISHATFRRGYAAERVLSTATMSGRERTGGVMMTRPADKANSEGAQKEPWVPDPKTGYYRPENSVEEIDVAELRAMLLRAVPQRGGGD